MKLLVYPLFLILIVGFINAYIVDNSFTYTYSKGGAYLYIGDLQFKPEAPVFDFVKCRINIDEPYSGKIQDVSNDCIFVDVYFDGKNYRMFKNNEYQLNKYVKVVFYATGSIIDDNVHNDYVERFSFTIDNSFLNIKTVQDTYYVKMNSQKYYPLSITNDLTSIYGGINAIYTQKMLFRQWSADENTELLKGTNDYNFPLPTWQLGEIDVEAKPFVTFTIPDEESRRIYADSKVKITYRIVQNVPEPPVINDTPLVCPAVYDPVCGVNGLTYGNSCWAEYYHVDIDYDGECKPIVACGNLDNPCCNGICNENLVCKNNVCSKYYINIFEMIIDFIKNIIQTIIGYFTK